MIIQPTYSEFKKCANRGNVIPMVLELPADLETPVSIFLKLARSKPHAFLLESVELEEKLGRFSLIGMDPNIILEHRNHHLCRRNRRNG